MKKELCYLGGKCNGECRKYHLHHDYRLRFQKTDICPCFHEVTKKAKRERRGE